MFSNGVSTSKGSRIGLSGFCHTRSPRLPNQKPSSVLCRTWFAMVQNSSKHKKDDAFSESTFFYEVLVGDIVAGKYLRECLIIK